MWRLDALPCPPPVGGELGKALGNVKVRLFLALLRNQFLAVKDFTR
jgi:hypothetical protein